MFSFNNYEGRKRPSKNNFGESMKDLIREARKQFDSPLYLLYRPRNTLYYINNSPIMIKQPDGSWSEGLHYIDVRDGKNYVRPFDLFKKEKWEVLGKPQASEMIQKGEITL